MIVWCEVPLTSNRSMLTIEMSCKLHCNSVSSVHLSFIAIMCVPLTSALVYVHLCLSISVLLTSAIVCADLCYIYQCNILCSSVSHWPVPKVQVCGVLTSAMVGAGDSPGAQRNTASPPSLSRCNLPQSPILMENKQGLPQSICHRHNFVAIFFRRDFAYSSSLFWFDIDKITPMSQRKERLMTLRVENQILF